MNRPDIDTIERGASTEVEELCRYIRQLEDDAPFIDLGSFNPETDRFVIYCRDQIPRGAFESLNKSIAAWLSGTGRALVIESGMRLGVLRFPAGGVVRPDFQIKAVAT